MLEPTLLILLSVTTPWSALPDTLRQAERDARRAAYVYERVIVTSAAQSFGGSRGQCDEVIGRFCFWYGRQGESRRPIEPDPPEVEEARDRAIHAFRRWFALAPGEFRAAGPLVRFLIEADRPREAVSAARAHVWAADETPSSLLLLGLGLHYARDFEAAEAAFDRARAAVPPAERRRLDDLGVLLEPSEHSIYRRLTEEEQIRFEERFWALSDPWHMDAGNERRSAHYARHTLSRIHALRPGVEGRIRWGRDHEELLIRYGLPVGRQRVLGPSTMAHRQVSLLEWYDPRRVAITPQALLTAPLPEAPPPGVRAHVHRDTTRSHYTPLGLRRAQGLIVQPSVFPEADASVLRVDALLHPDTVDPRVPQRPEALLVVMDTLGREVARTPVTARVRPDSTTVLSAEQRLWPGPYVYRVEVRDTVTGLAGLAQYRIHVAGREGLTLSDILVAAPVSGPAPTSRSDGTLEALPLLVLPPTQRISVYAEVSGLEANEAGASFGVQWWLERAEPGGVLRRAARWVGRQIGLVEEETPQRVGWQEATSQASQALFVTLDLSGVDPGLHRLSLRVRDHLSGQERTTTRLVRIDPEAAARVASGSR